MALTNAEKQKRWRDKRNDLATDLVGAPTEIAENILRRLGPEATGKVAKALAHRLRNLRADCTACGGTGFAQHRTSTPCGVPVGQMSIKCDCSRRRRTDSA